MEISCSKVSHFLNGENKFLSLSFVWFPRVG